MMSCLPLRRIVCAGLWMLVALIVSVLPISGQGRGDDPLYVALIWHQHQPVYFKDPETNIYLRPWVRVHAAKDYLDMATMLEQYPDVHATFNITPSLIRQLDDFAAGAKDLYWVHSEIPAEELTTGDKRFILERFFDANPKMIARFPRYQELADLRTDSGVEEAIDNWPAQDFRDLQVLFNLAWTDPDFLAEAPLANLVLRARNFDESDKVVVLDEHLRIIREVIPTHARLQDTGQIEVTMTPFAHPILPLLTDSNLAAVAMPEAVLPSRFVFGQDAVAQVQLGIQFYEDHFGRSPRGMWPAEGSVSQSVVQMIANAGLQWIATDEGVLAHSLPEIRDFTRDDQDTVQQADSLYRPYTATGGRGGQVAIIFRDNLISDKVGFEYSGTPGEEAAADFIQRLENIRERLATEGGDGPHLVTVLLDGENAWEHYDNDGKAFLHALYQGLSASETLRTVTPSEFLDMSTPPREIADLWPGSWINHDFSTWIGEEEENQAWEYLLTTREALQKASRGLDEDTLQEALSLMYIAEGSDWFWWYGADQNSGADEDFDAQFRGYLAQIYALIGQTTPDFVHIPVIPQQAQQPDSPFTDSVVVQVDGVITQGEWDTAAFYDLDVDTGDVAGLHYGFDEDRLYLRLDSLVAFAGTEIGFYFSTPDDDPTNAYTRYETSGNQPVLGFGANRLLELAYVDSIPTLTLYVADGKGGWEEETAFEQFAIENGTLELAASLEVLSPAARSADPIVFRVVTMAAAENVVVAPSEGPALAVLPDTAVPNIVLDVTDPAGDDHGPGPYVYPTDQVFRPAAYDATGFVVGYDDEDVIFRINFRGPVENDWDAPNGMGIHTVDIYIDKDGPQTGKRLLLPGRNAALQEGFGWDVAIWAEGWTPGIFAPGEDGPVEIGGSLSIITNPGQRRITIRVSRNALPGDPSEWAFAVTVAGQEGFPAAGVWRIRDVLAEAEQWRIGGAPDDTNHTRILDVVYPEAGVQEAMLSNYRSSTARIGELGPDDFGQVPVISGDHK